MNKILQLKKIIENEGFVYIQTHNFPDPDAIACAFGLQFLLNQFNIKSKIIYSGFIISQTMNDMIEKLKIRVYHSHSVKIKKTSKIILVDTQLCHENVRKLDAQYIGCIDHHESGKKDELNFYDLRPEAGACSSIIGQYILDLRIDKIPENVATALLIGIYIDTFRLSRKTTQMDVRIVDKMFPYVNMELLGFLTINNINLQDLDKFKHSIKNLKIINDIGIVQANTVKTHHLLAIICDFFMQLRELNLVIGYSIKKNKISISVRNEIKKYNASKIAGKITENIGSGGGHNSMAAGIVDLSLVRKNFNFEKHLISIIRNL